MILARIIAISLSVLMLASCGGGSSSSNGGTAVIPTPPPPPPVIFTFEASVPFQPVLEENIFPIEVSSTARNVQVTQISGPIAVELENSETATSTWLAPSLENDVTEKMVFELTANDTSGATGTTTITVDLRGFTGPGKPVVLSDTGIELLAGTFAVPAQIGGGLNGSIEQIVGSVPQFPGSDDNPRKFVFFGGETGGYVSYRIDDITTSEVIFSESSFFEIGTLSFNLQGDSGPGDNFVLLDAAEDLFRYLVSMGSSSRYTVSEAESFAIENPCYVAERVNTGQDFIWVGQSDNGLSVVQLLPTGNGQFGTKILNEIGNERSLCHIVTTRLSDRISPSFSNDDSGFSDLITVDFDTNELVLYGDMGENRQYDELESIPIKTGTTADLSIVDVFSRGTETSLPNYLVILLADESVDGDHRLVLVAQNEDDREIFQTVYPLGAGIPVALLDGPFIGDRPFDQIARDVVVVTQDSGASILEFIQAATTGAPPTYGPPIFLIRDTALEALLLATYRTI